MWKLLASSLGVVLALGHVVERSSAQCVVDWAAGFEPRGVVRSASVKALGVYDDGTGPALYVGGYFHAAGGADAQYIAKWDGANWAALPSPPNAQIYALAAFDDGSGPALYAGGKFTMAGGKQLIWYITKWNGRTWEPVGPGLVGYVRALCEYDDGTGPALYAGGSFRQVYQGPTVNGIAKWDGKQWSPLGSGMWSPDFAPAVYALDVFGPQVERLYAGGHFYKAGDVVSPNLARWNGKAWSPPGACGPGNDVYALTAYDDGSGPALYVAGGFRTACGQTVNYIAKWDGTSWSPLAVGVSHWVYALAVYDDGTGPALYAGGEFETAGGVPARGIGKWDGSNWSPVGNGVNGPVLAMTVFDDGRGPALYAGGEFDVAAGVGAYRIARWDGKTWSALGDGNGTSGGVAALCEGPKLDAAEEERALYAGGYFKAVGGLPASGIARWDGTRWAALGTGVEDWVYALTFFDDGGGPALYAGGGFIRAGGVPAREVAKWDGAKWSGLGTDDMDGSVYGLTVFDDGHGPALYICGEFTVVAGVPANRIAKWDGSKWSSLGGGLTGASNASARALAVFDDGRGPALYAGGDFIWAGGIKVNKLARWDGREWSGLRGGLTFGGEVLTVHVFDDGHGPALYAAGYFTQAGGVLANNIAKWDGSKWSALGAGTNEAVWALGTHDDGRGRALYAGGYFESAGGVPASNIAKWDGSRWSPLGGGVNDGVRALATLDDGYGPALYVGGGFYLAGGRVSAYIARWGCIPGLKLGDANCDGKVDWLDIDPFVLALCRPAEYERQFPTCRLRTADCNADGVVNNFDIDPFVKLLTP